MAATLRGKERANRRMNPALQDMLAAYEPQTPLDYQSLADQIGVG